MFSITSCDEGHFHITPDPDEFFAEHAEELERCGHVHIDGGSVEPTDTGVMVSCGDESTFYGVGYFDQSVDGRGDWEPACEQPCAQVTVIRGDGIHRSRVLFADGTEVIDEPTGKRYVFSRRVINRYGMSDFGERVRFEDYEISADKIAAGGEVLAVRDGDRWLWEVGFDEWLEVREVLRRRLRDVEFPGLEEFR